MRPDVLLMDEALSVGDRLFRQKVYGRLERFQESGGTLVLVSHDLDLLRQFCSRVIWLRDGRIEADGEAAAVLNRYHAAK
jgi:ABC-type polysaccharide/polyol phosphate transport system ATPase subunit